MIEPTIDYLPPTSPMSPSLDFQESYQNANISGPLLDLIETEQRYVEDLKCLLMKVTANWSSDDLPPPDLDQMFRHIELIYKQNKKFYLKLCKIGTDQVYLDDILMGWINDMNDPYTKYIENFTIGFDSRPEIEENLSLQQTLNDISAEKNQPVSLEHFFDMPIKRLHYYKKFYTRLYKSTEPGSSDGNLLLDASERIDLLLEMEKEIKNSDKIKEVTVAEGVTIFPPIVAEDVYSVTVPAVEVYQVEEEYEGFEGSYGYYEPEGYEYYEQDYVVADSPPMKFQTIDSPVYPSITVSTEDWNLEELERQLDTSKTKDLFTKLPKVVKVSLLSTDLPFKREIILHDDFTIGTTKFMNSSELFNMNVHVFLLTDLLLICQLTTQEESLSEKNLRLIFPPLNLDFIVISDVSDGGEEILELTILQKEMLIFYPKNKNVKNVWFREITKAIDFTTNASPSPRLSISLRRAESNPRLSTASSISMSPNGLKRSPSVGNLINRDIKSLRPVSQMSSISQNSSVSPDYRNKDLPEIPEIPVRSRTPEPPRNAGGAYPGDYLPSGQGIGQDRHSDPMSSSEMRNKLNSELQIERHSEPISSPNRNLLGAELHTNTARYERSNSITSLASVVSIATFRETIFRSSACKVFIWTNENWKLLTSRDNCIVEVRMTVQDKGCWVILLESSNKMVLNAWVNSTTTLRREDANSVSISCETGQGKEFYKVTSVDSEESDQFLNNLLRIKESVRRSNVPVKGFISRSSSLQTVEPAREVEQTITQIMETRCRVFLQNDHGVWTNIGWGNMKLSLETPSHRKRIIVNSDKKSKTTIIDSIIREDGVERIGKSVAVTLNNVGNNMRIIYLLKMKDEALAIKVFDIIKEKRNK